MKSRLALVLVSLWLAAAPASAQLGGLGLPPLGSPQVPPVGGVVNGLPGADLPNANETLNTLGQTMQEQTQTLLRRHRRELEPDPDGHAIVRSQIIALAPSEAALAAARAAGFQVVRSDDLGESGALITLRAPPSMPTSRALRVLREADPNGTYDFDHLHIESGAVAPVTATAQLSASGAGPRIGLIDTGVDPPRGVIVVAQRGFAGERAIPSAHGAAIANLAASAAPGARFYIADIYGGAPTGGASSAMARALAWLAGEGTPVINVSLVGPRNRVVETMVGQLARRGFLIVAAVGNDGPAAPPLFPAAYPGVVGVTGVDQRQHVLVEAGQGDHVDFSAPGVVDRRRRGTSFAAPVVAGLLAARFVAPDAEGAQRAVAALRAQARDLGARGRDEVYGEGFVDVNSSLASR